MKLDSKSSRDWEVVTPAKIDIKEVSSKTSVPTPANPQQDVSGAEKTPWGILATTFITIFLAEIGDKTQLSTLLMSAESHAPWVVFVGSATALILTSLLGVLVGSWMASKLSPKTINKAAGVTLLFISLMLFWDLGF